MDWQLDWTGPQKWTAIDRTLGPVALSLDQLQLQLHEDRSQRATDKKPVATGYGLDYRLHIIGLYSSYN
jgi:hypothetical protein